MQKSLTINSGSVVPVGTIRSIRSIRAIGPEERAGLVDRYGDAAADFNISIQFADKSTKLARQSLDDVRGQGIGLVNIGVDRHVIAANSGAPTRSHGRTPPSSRPNEATS
jgi:hypothetical protein